MAMPLRKSWSSSTALANAMRPARIFRSGPSGSNRRSSHRTLRRTAVGVHIAPDPSGPALIKRSPPKRAEILRELYRVRGWGQGALACINKLHQAPWFHRFQENPTSCVAVFSVHHKLPDVEDLLAERGRSVGSRLRAGR